MSTMQNTFVFSDQPVPEVVVPMGPVVRVKANTGISATYFFLFLVIVTALAGCVNIVVNNQLNVIIGVAFVCVSILTAFLVRPLDKWSAIILPPLAYVVAVSIVGQAIVLTDTSSLLVHEAAMFATTLATAAPFLFASVFASAVVVACRSMISRRKQNVTFERYTPQH